MNSVERLLKPMCPLRQAQKIEWLRSLYIVAEPVPLVEVADRLAAEMTNLSAANPDLPQAELLSAGTVLVRPVEQGSALSATE